MMELLIEVTTLLFSLACILFKCTQVAGDQIV